MSAYRLLELEHTGSLIDRHRPLQFSFDSRSFSGLAGDSLASALLANGVSLVGRSFKYHRPRGVYTIGVEEPNALVTLHPGPRRDPNTKATMVELYPGLVAESQNRWPSLGFDLMAVNGLFAPLLSAGFYYKTFIGPTRGAWMFYERFIRNAAGMGRAGLEPDPDRYEKLNAFCDVLVVGSGPAGLAAAYAAASSGARVILCEEMACLGGSLVADATPIDGIAGRDWCAQMLARLAGFANLRLMPRTTVYGYFDSNTLGALERVGDHLPAPAFVPTRAGAPRQRHWTIRAGRVILATGALERPIVFDNNDLPGIMLADAARRYALHYGVAIGRRVAVFTNNNTGYRAALDLRHAGVEVTTVIDSRSVVAGEIADAVAGQGIRLLRASAVRRALGGKALEAIEVGALAGGAAELIEIDALALSGGFSRAGVAGRPRDGATLAGGDRRVCAGRGHAAVDCRRRLQRRGLARGMPRAGFCRRCGGTRGARIPAGAADHAAHRSARKAV